MNAQPGLKLDSITRSRTRGQFICLQWALPHYKAGDCEARKNWGNFPNPYISSPTMRFPNPEESWFLTMSQLGLECKPDNKPPKFWYSPYDVCCSVCQGLVAWVDDTNPRSPGPSILPEASGTRLRPMGGRLKNDKALHGNAFTSHASRYREITQGPQVLK